MGWDEEQDEMGLGEERSLMAEACICQAGLLEQWAMIGAVGNHQKILNRRVT